MRRIYESDALSRDEDDPFSPRGSDEKESRSLNWSALSHAILPAAVRRRAVSVAVETDKRRYESDETVLIRVTFHNRLPFPVAVPTKTPVPWHWSVDGRVAAMDAPPDEPDESSLFRFERNERKIFTRRWDQLYRVDERHWEPAGAGEHDLSVAINTPMADETHLRAETTIRTR
ncbi:hypothetical protein U4E84_05270 [Halorubrum sp. AD140]|uniref:hypothetical protein n=1 Tax=Halorubrum sp. AD140 TaxID=3050073 RepID=UPI002ACC562B|nr:hypothetical protein [Halorubrum sp. AD140]MDZ5810758.1 hypothetical protein [Halorubrum sp. AD140]